MQLLHKYTLTLAFIFLEPAFELAFLCLHNFVFYYIAGVQFSGVSIGAMLGFLCNFHLQNMYIEQYMLMLPFAACLGVFILVRRLFGAPIYLGQLLAAAAYVWLLLWAILLFSKYNILHLASWAMFSSAALSALYWFSSVSLAWSLACGLPGGSAGGSAGGAAGGLPAKTRTK